MSEADPTVDREYVDALIAQSKQRLARIIDLEAALEAIAAHEDAPDDHCHQIAQEALRRA